MKMPSTTERFAASGNGAGLTAVASLHLESTSEKNAFQDNTTLHKEIDSHQQSISPKDSVEIIAPIEKIQTLFKLPYNTTQISIAIRRIGKTLVLNGILDESTQEHKTLTQLQQQTKRRQHQLRIKSSLLSSESKHISQKYKNKRKKWRGQREKLFRECRLPSSSLKESPDTASSDSDEEYLEPQLQTDEETGEIFVLTRVPVRSKHYTYEKAKREEQEYQRALYQKFLYHFISRASVIDHHFHQLSIYQPIQLPVPSLQTPVSFSAGSTFSTTPQFGRVLNWHFHNFQMHLGSDTVMSDVVTIPSTNLTQPFPVALHDMSSDFSVNECLDLWLNNVMSNTTHTAICYHKGGDLQGYQMVGKQDIPRLMVTKGQAGICTDHEPPVAFDPENVKRSAKSILEFLEENCLDEDGTYWLTRFGDELNTLRLFQLKSQDVVADGTMRAPEEFESDIVVDRQSRTPFDTPVGLVSYQVATHLGKDLSNAQDMWLCRRLYWNSIQLIDAEDPVYVDVRRRAFLELGEIYIRPYRPLSKSFTCTSRRIMKEVSLGHNPDAFYDRLKEKLSLYSIAKAMYPQQKAPCPGKSEEESPSPLDDEVQLNEDICRGLFCMQSALHLLDSEAAQKLQSKLFHGFARTYFFLAQQALMQAKYGQCLEYTTHVVSLLNGRYHSCIALIMGQIHIGLALNSDEENMLQQQKDSVETRIKVQQSTYQSLRDIKSIEWIKQSAMEDILSWDPERHLAIASKYFMMVVKRRFSVARAVDVLETAADDCSTACVAKLGLQHAYIALGRHYIASGRFTKAIRYVTQGYQLFRALDDNFSIVRLHCFKAEIHLQKAIALVQENKTTLQIDMDTALSTFKETREWLEQVDPTVEGRDEFKQRLDRLQRLLHLQYATMLEQHMSSSGTIRKHFESALALSHTDEATADTLFQMASFLSRNASEMVHLERKLQTRDEAVSMFNTVLEYLPLSSSNCLYHLLIRLDIVKLLLQRMQDYHSLSLALSYLVGLNELCEVSEKDDTSVKTRQVLEGLRPLIYTQLTKILTNVLKGKLKSTLHAQYKEMFRFYLQNHKQLSMSKMLAQLQVLHPDMAKGLLGRSLSCS